MPLTNKEGLKYAIKMRVNILLLGATRKYFGRKQGRNGPYLCLMSAGFNGRVGHMIFGCKKLNRVAEGSVWRL